MSKPDLSSCFWQLILRLWKNAVVRGTPAVYWFYVFSPKKFHKAKMYLKLAVGISWPFTEFLGTKNVLKCFCVFAGSGKARKLVQSGYSFHSCKRSFQKNPTMRSMTRLQLSVIIECFLTSKFCKGFLTLQVQQSSLGLETTVFNYFPSRQFLCPSKLRYQGKILVKCVQKGTFFWKPLTYPMHIIGGERSFPYG